MACKSILIFSIFSFLANGASFLPNSFRSEIKQSYKSQIKGKLRESSGFIEYQYPGNLILSVEGKNNFTLVMNKKTSWYYQPPFMEGMKGEVSIGDTKTSPLYESLNLLRHGLKSNKYYKVKTLKQENHLLIPASSQKKFGIKEIRLHFKKSQGRDFKNLSFMELFPLNQEKVTIIFEKVNSSIKFSKDHFNFQVPKNTNINGKISKKSKVKSKGK